MKTVCIGLTWYSPMLSFDWNLLEWLCSWSYGCGESACHIGVMAFGLQLDFRIWDVEKVLNDH